MLFFQEKYAILKTIAEEQAVSYYKIEEKENGGSFRCAKIHISSNSDELEDVFSALQVPVITKITGFVECLECETGDYAFFVFTNPSGTSLETLVKASIATMNPLPETFIVQLTKKLLEIASEYAPAANSSCPLFFTPPNVFVEYQTDSDNLNLHIVTDFLGLLARPYDLSVLSFAQSCYVPLDYLVRVNRVVESAAEEKILVTNTMIAWNIGAIVHYAIYQYNLINLPFASTRSAEHEQKIAMFPTYYTESLHTHLNTLLSGILPSTKQLTHNSQREMEYLAAIKSGNLLYVKEYKDEMSYVRDKNGYTGLMLAVTHNWIDVVKELCATEARMTTPTGFTAMMLACIYKKAESVLLLRDHEKQITLPNGKTAMMIAAAQNNLECVKALASKDYELGLQDATGKTALMHAISMHCEETCRFLAGIEYGYQDATGATALNHLVGYHSFPNFDTVARKLIEHPEELVANDDGETPYTYAAANGNLYAVQLFTELGVGGDSGLGLKYALRSGQLNLATFLMGDREYPECGKVGDAESLPLDTYFPMIYGLKGNT